VGRNGGIEPEDVPAFDARRVGGGVPPALGQVRRPVAAAGEELCHCGLAGPRGPEVLFFHFHQKQGGSVGDDALSPLEHGQFRPLGVQLDEVRGAQALGVEKVVQSHRPANLLTGLGLGRRVEAGAAVGNVA